ncbi:MAG: DUF6445 family protein [Alphaproteobacteria bacterium]
MYRSIVVVDAFYPDPHEVRNLALGCVYPEVTGQRSYPGRNSRKKFSPDGFDQMISYLIGENVVGLDDMDSSHGRFRITLAGEETRWLVHVHPTYLGWVGVVYLNLPEHRQGGTEFYRHRAFDSDRTPVTEAELQSTGAASIVELLDRDGNDTSRWEHLMTVPTRFNRLVLYRPWLWHSAAEPFGDSPKNGRLIQLLSFVTTQ